MVRVFSATEWTLMMIEFGNVRNRVCDQRTSTLRRESALYVVFVITSCTNRVLYEFYRDARNQDAIDGND